MILDFSLRNYKSFAEEGFISFVSPQLKTETPKNGKTWEDVVSPVAVVYGSNAAGKTTLVRGLADLSYALYRIGHRLHKPSMMDSEAAEKPTEYTVNFTVEQERYLYEVTAFSWGILHEALYTYPAHQNRSSKRTIFVRTQESADSDLIVRAGNTLEGPTQAAAKLTRSNHLFLAVAQKFNHEMLSTIASGIRFSQAVEAVMPNEDDRKTKIRWITQQVASDPKKWGDIANSLVKVADIGIERVEVDEREINPELLESIRAQIAEKLEDKVEIPENLIKQITSSLTFIHKGKNGQEVKLSINAQSEGTKNWLALAGQMVSCLRNGELLIIDELDMSLHPELVSVFVSLFKNKQHNKKGAQLLCTTHDTNLLNNKPTTLLAPEEVWFIEKDEEGNSSSFSLYEFKLKKTNNAENKYLAGAFGAIPQLRLSALEDCLAGQL